MPNQPDLSKTYEPQKCEDNIYAAWEKSGFFNPDVCIEKGVCKKDAKPFSIVLPPPNATGALHIGHAMMLAIEDLLIRYHRMKGDKTLWLPGTDHAAIATNAVVEKLLAKEGKTKHDFGREAFVAKVKNYIKNSQDNIRNQVRKMGSSLDWSREAYTWDEPRNLAVRTMFKKMYDDGLIYRGSRIVNWCPHCQSTLADDEVEYREEHGKFYWIKYGPFILATSRPETKLGDTAVAVHPGDERYKDMVGKKYMIPGVLGEFEVIVVADEAVDPTLGTGAVKVTPAHSFTDYEIAERHNVPLKQIIGEDGRMMANCGKYAGMTTIEARAAILVDMEKMGLIDHVEENYIHNLSICYRCKNVIEPLPSRQWFIDVNKEFSFKQSSRHPISGLKNEQKVTLKKLMQQVVKNGQIEIIPERFNKIYFHWIDNLRDWCISRQIWVGHQIPVWYRGVEGVKGDEGVEGIFVGLEAPKGEGWIQDTDTLDTWFSAGLWTFSTLGWPDLEAKDLKIYHPTAVLETMFDLIFFWVARMIMMSTYALGEVPFEKVYFHARVLDKDGEKMSKSKPETMIDPLDVCEKFGTDAVRLSLLLGISPGSDVRLSEDKIAGFRNFTNKLWNIARFVLTTVGARQGAPTTKTLADRWILGRLAEVTEKVTNCLEKYEFSQAGEALRDFTWSELADWYLEIAKIQRKDAALQESTDQILLYVLEQVLVLWHPFMPFVTEEIWKNFSSDQLLIVHNWPEVKSASQDNAEFERLKEIIEKIRNWRAENKVEPKEKINVMLIVGEHFEIFKEAINLEIIKTLARVENLAVEENKEKSFDYQFKVDRQIDTGKERERLSDELENVQKYIVDLDAKLANQEFISKAPAKVVEGMKQKKEDAAKKAEALSQQIKNL